MQEGTFFLALLSESPTGRSEIDDSTSFLLWQTNRYQTGHWWQKTASHSHTPWHSPSFWGCSGEVQQCNPPLPLMLRPCPAPRSYDVLSLPPWLTPDGVALQSFTLQLSRKQTWQHSSEGSGGYLYAYGAVNQTGVWECGYRSHTVILFLLTSCTAD